MSKDLKAFIMPADEDYKLLVDELTGKTFVLTRSTYNGGTDDDRYLILSVPKDFTFKYT